MNHLIKISAISILLLYFTLCLTSCKKKPPLPVVTTTSVTGITMTTAESGGNVTDDGGAEITSKGVCWNTTENPTTDNSKTSNSTGTGIFTSSLTQLTANTTYYVRAYATNSAGTGYGEQIVIKTYTGTVADIDGNTYYTVTIGTQVWMAGNLRTTKYVNGNPISTTTPATKDISAETSPKYQWAYNGDESTVATYGRLYTWFTVKDSRNVCPTGWHLPSDPEWETLKSSVGVESTAGGKLKEMGTIHWQSPNTGATNETGFTAVPGGGRNYTAFYSLGVSCYYLSSTKNPYNANWCWGQGMYSDSTILYRGGLEKSYGHSVRCMKN